MKPFATTYIADGSRFSSYLWASDFDHADEVAKRRGMGETVDGLLEAVTEPRVSDQIRSQDPDALHGLVWLCHLAISAAAVEPEAVLGDCGVLHQLIHRHFGVGEVDLEELARQVAEIEEATPGFLEGEAEISGDSELPGLARGPQEARGHEPGGGRPASQALGTGDAEGGRRKPGLPRQQVAQVATRRVDVAGQSGQRSRTGRGLCRSD